MKNVKSIYRYTVLKEWRRKRQTGKKQDVQDAEEKQEQGGQGDGERKKRQEGGEGKRRPGLEGRRGEGGRLLTEYKRFFLAARE